MRFLLADGVYSLSYRNPADTDGAACGLAIVRDRTIIGSDSAGGVFLARLDAQTGQITGEFIVPADGELITGLRAGSEGMEIAFQGVPLDCGSHISLMLNLGAGVVAVGATYVGPLPDGLGAVSNALRP